MSNPAHDLVTVMKLREFTVFAQLLSLRNGGQMGIAQLDEFDQLDSPADDESIVSLNTTAADRGFDARDLGLRKRFLDRLSELLAYERGGDHVSCAVLREDEAEGRVDIWVARNTGFHSKGKSGQGNSRDDFAMIEMLEETVGTVATGQPGKPVIYMYHELMKIVKELSKVLTRFWEHLLSFYSSRLRSFRNLLAKPFTIAKSI